MKNVWSVEQILFCKRLDFQAKTQNEKKGVGNDKMTHQSKSKAFFLSINLNAHQANFDFREVKHVHLLDTLQQK